MGVPHMDASHLGYINHIPLVWPNEPARHKLLDIIGDLALIGKPIKGRIIATRPGHTINNKFARQLRKEIRLHEIQAPIYNCNEPPLMDVNRIRELLPHRYRYRSQPHRRREECHIERTFLPRAFPARAGHAGCASSRSHGTSGRPVSAQFIGRAGKIFHLLPEDRQCEVPPKSSAGRYPCLPCRTAGTDTARHLYHERIYLRRRKNRLRSRIYGTNSKKQIT